MVYPVYTEVTSCRDCYKCVRVCPVKAIQIKDGHAMIRKERCIFCGECVHVCPTKAKKIRSDVARVKLALSQGRRNFCSLAASWTSEFAGEEKEFLAALRKLGFTDISETAIGAELVSEATDKYIEKKGECNWISTACPSVVELVKKYYPSELNRLAIVPSPLQTHSAYLRKLYGRDILIVHIGPCLAAKHEADTTPGYPDYALTFDELRRWMRNAGIRLDEIEVGEEVGFVPAYAGLSSLYAIEGGQIRTGRIWGSKPLCSDALSLSGTDSVKSALADGHGADEFLELRSCSGGCINGPGGSRKKSLTQKKRRIITFVEERLARPEKLFRGDSEFAEELLCEGYALIGSEQPRAEDGFAKKHTEAEIQRALIELGKLTKADELNCAGCGYGTCREMAVALLEGMAEPEMCVTNMRKEAQSKVDVLLRTIPLGVVIVDSDMNIQDCNTQFLDIFGEMEKGFIDQDVLGLIRGLPVERFIPFADRFREQFDLEKPGQYRIHYKDKFLRVTFFLVEKQRLLGAMFDDITNPMIKRETVVKKAEDVIQKSLETVQQIASLLGENAAETEIMLNSLIDAFSVHSPSQDKDFAEDDGRDIT